MAQYYIGTEQQCLNYDAQVTAGENYSGVTQRWAKPIQNYSDETQFAMPKHPKYEDAVMPLVDALDETWFPPINIPSPEQQN